MVILKINDNTRAEDVPAKLRPGVPPNGIVSPAIGRNIHVILSSQHVLDWSPIVHVNIAAILRIVSTSAIGISFNRFHKDFFAVEVFISNYLQDRLPPADDFNFDNGYVLYGIPIHQCLQDNGVKIALLPVLYTDVINPAVVIQVQVVDPVFFGINLPLKVP